MKKIKKLQRILEENGWFWYLIIFIICFFLFGFLHSEARFLDPDSFYHAKMAVLIQEQGLIIDFPWLPFTGLSNYYIDQHLLYHLFLIPFILFLDPLVGLKLATVIFAALFFVFFYWFLKKVNPQVNNLINLIFTLFLLLCHPFIFRLNLAKVPALSLIFLLIGFYLIIQRRYWRLTIFCFFYVYLYGGWPLILVVLFLYILVNATRDFIQGRKKRRKKLEIRNWKLRSGFKTLISNFQFLVSCFFKPQYWKLVGSSLAGLVGGVVLNPYFPRNLKFYWQQLVEIGIINYQAVVRVGMEWHGYGLSNLFLDTALLSILLVVAIIVFVISYQRQSQLTWVTLLLTIFFFLITLKSQRYVEYYIPFAVLFSVFSLSSYLTNQILKKHWQDLKDLYFKKTILVTTLAIFWLVALTVIGAEAWITNWRVYHLAGRPWHQFQQSSEWLRDEAPPGAIIFHSDWDEFPQLFYYNDQNYYIAGLDPTFLYQQNKDLYQRFENITLGKLKVGLASLIKNYFQADYIFVDSQGHDSLVENLEAAAHIELVYQDEEAIIFKIK